MRICELSWQADPTLRFGHFAGRPWAVLLDSCRDRNERGRYDIFSAEPYATLECSGKRAVYSRGGERQALHGDPFQLLAELMGPPEARAEDLPFCGGVIGYLSYELGRGCVGLSAPRSDLPDYPELAFGFYDWVVINDHQEQRSCLVARDRVSSTRRIWDDLQSCLQNRTPAAEPSYRMLAPLQANFSQDAYAAAFQAVQDYIEAGDCYQVNLAQRFSAPSEGRLWAAYRSSRAINPAPFSAYFHHPALEIASASPERFLQVLEGRVETCPIKGTSRRLPGDEERQREQLRQSAKDRAENLMIVDLLRNDLSKNCARGTVEAPDLFRVESFATVHHLVSTVTGQLREGRTALDLLEGCFPGGSITGAPKRRAMEIIEELEPVPRGVYCGSLAYIGFDGNMDSSIAIRTMVQAEGQTSLYAGGGLTHSSQMEAEYQECLDKAAAMQETLERYLRQRES